MIIAGLHIGHGRSLSLLASVHHSSHQQRTQRAQTSCSMCIRQSQRQCSALLPSSNSQQSEVLVRGEYDCVSEGQAKHEVVGTEVKLSW
jgi:hypothetical protein